MADAPDTMMQEAAARLAAAAAAAVPVPRSERQQYPVHMAVDFTQLRPNALRRYLAFHGIRERPGSSKDDLAVLVARHFNEECKRADEASSIASFVSYLTQEEEGAGHELKRRRLSDAAKENHSRGAAPLGDQFDPGYAPDYDDGFDEDGYRLEYYDDVEDEDDFEDPTERSSGRKPRASSFSRREGSSSGSSGGGNALPKKKKRKARVYCVCKGSSFGDMIACDNKKCLDRYNWYHMSCVGLDPKKAPPETWFCPLCQGNDLSEIPENQYRKPVASVTYGDMISHALKVLPEGKGSFKEICDFVEKQYESQLNWKLESDQRKSPVWKSSVRKILFSNMRFRKHPEDKGLFCLAA